MKPKKRAELEQQLDALEKAMNDVWQASTLEEAMQRHEETKQQMKWLRLQIAAINHEDTKH